MAAHACKLLYSRLQCLVRYLCHGSSITCLSIPASNHNMCHDGCNAAVARRRTSCTSSADRRRSWAVQQRSSADLPVGRSSAEIEMTSPATTLGHGSSGRRVTKNCTAHRPRPPGPARRASNRHSQPRRWWVDDQPLAGAVSPALSLGVRLVATTWRSTNGQRD